MVTWSLQFGEVVDDTRLANTGPDMEIVLNTALHNTWIITVINKEKLQL